MSIRDIRPSNQDTICDVCGRTLLRGEVADTYLDGATRRSVCELCKERALHEGWMREGTVSGYEEGQAGPDRRRSLLGRLRPRREVRLGAVPTLRDELDGHAWAESAPGGRDGLAVSREPRHVRAVPTSADQKVASGVALFNQSEHPRTVAGVARSLGAPSVSVMPSATAPSQVRITVVWELCWYRYEVDLADEVPAVRPAGQGYELSELSPEEMAPNAAANERGELALVG